MRIAICAISFVIATHAFAQEPQGCDKFKWPVDAERALLVAEGVVSVPSGTAWDRWPVAAVALQLKPVSQADLPKPPERMPKAPNVFAGFVRMSAPVMGTYQLSLSAEAWLDVVQHGAYLKPVAFSGVVGCDGIRKTVRFSPLATPVVIQVSSSSAETIRLVVTRVP